MKLKYNLILSQVGDDTIAVPIGENAAAFRGIIRFNSSGGFIMKAIIDGQEPAQIEQALLAEYEDLDAQTARRAVQSVVEKLRADGVLEEEKA